MKRYYLLRNLFIIVVVGLSLLLFFMDHETAKAQQTYPRFLYSPYYGNKSLTTWFDHEIPTYATNGSLVIYSGVRRTVVDNRTCTPGWGGNCYDGHPGIDFGTGYEQILAAAGGTVIWAGWPEPLVCHECGLGIHVIIQHSVNNVSYQTIYGHLSTTGVQEGDVVKAGQVIGTSGSTGNSTGPHLHFEVNIYLNGNWRRIDPFGWQPVPGGIQTDPWASVATSWCMWSSGQWVNYCDSTQPSSPLPTPFYFATEIVDDVQESTGNFYKGYGGFLNNSCIGVDPDCQKWWVTGGYGGDAYRTIASGNKTPSNWAMWIPVISDNYTRLYEIFIYIPSPTNPANTYTWQARYYISDAYNVWHTVIVDEYVGNGQNYNPYNIWRSIGVYPLNSISNVYVTDATEEDTNIHCPSGPAWPPGSPYHWCRMLVDGVKFAQVQRRIFLPVIQNHIMAYDPPPGTPSPTPTLTPAPTLTPTAPTPYP